MRVGTSVRVAAAAGALALVGTVLLAAPPAWATVTTYTWTGIDAASTTTPNPAWSDPANWGGTAPPAGSAVDLAFPASVCASGSNACNGVDDISGLFADTVTIGTPSAPSGSQPPPGYQMSAASSQTLTLDGGFNLTGAPSATSNFSVDVFAIPVVLGAPNTWSLAGPSNLILPSGLSGTSQSLQMNMSQSAIVTLSGTTNEVGPVDVTGANTSATGYSANENGTLFVYSDLNGTDLSPVTAANVAVTSLGATMGPLGVSGGWLALVSPTSGSPGGSGVTAVQGGLNLDSATVVQYQSLTAPSSPPTPGTDYPQITSTATASLGGAQLSVMADCGMADGTTFTLVSAGSVSGTFDHFTGYGATPGPITDGEVIQADPGAGCNSSPGPYLRINYTATTVTATVVPQPTTTTTLSASPASPQVNEAYQLVAT
ncbi:MAG TPA: hypothetical protein VFN68_07510, partial [Acidimicrobiales bacterium]|nr:hypothetical protein [Acidimicrobiales bacterium]